MSIYTVVKARESLGEHWKEVAAVTTVSGSGAGFSLTRPCNVGRLVSMMLPLPPMLRCYDHDKELYRVWGLVQHCQPQTTNDEAVYHIGVAFVGKEPPPSYRENPLQNYRISGMNNIGLWKIDEADAPFVSRRHPRFWVGLEVEIALLNAGRDIVKKEKTRTENISLRGAAVFTTLDANTGDRVEFTSDEHDFSVLAVVRNRKTGADDRTRLHLEFVTGDFPITTIARRIESSRKN